MAPMDTTNIIPKRFGLRYDPPELVLEWLEPSTGKLFHRVMGLSRLKKTSDPEKVVAKLKLKNQGYLADDKINLEQVVCLVKRLQKGPPKDGAVEKETKDTIKPSSSSKKEQSPDYMLKDNANNKTAEKDGREKDGRGSAEKSAEKDGQGGNSGKKPNSCEKLSGSDLSGPSSAGKSSPMLGVLAGSTINASSSDAMPGRGAMPATAMASFEKDFQKPFEKDFRSMFGNTGTNFNSTTGGLNFNASAGSTFSNEISLSSPPADNAVPSFPSLGSLPSLGPLGNGLDKKQKQESDKEFDDILGNLLGEGKDEPDSPYGDSFDSESPATKKKIGIEGFDYENFDLNKLTQDEVKIHKTAMDEEFERNRIVEGDPGFVYDKRQDFVEPTKACEWDSD